MNHKNLRSLNIDALKPVSRAPGRRHTQQTIGIAEQKHIRKAARRTFLNQLSVSNAAAALDRLPAACESFHGIMAGNFHAFAFLPAILRLAGCKAVEVNICTLGFNANNSAELFDLLDRGDVQSALSSSPAITALPSRK